MFFRRLLPFALSLLLILTPLSGAADGLPELGESAQTELSPQMEQRIGRDLMNEIMLKERTYIDDPEINDYLNQLGQRLVAASPDPTGNFNFFVLRDPEINAFAMFGGYIGTNTGTLLAAENESELAGVLAHEISHVTQHHLARQIALSKQQSLLGMIAMGVALLAARSNAELAGAGVTAVGAATVQSQLAFSRDFEREADRFGYETLEKAGFDPRGISDFFIRLQKATRVYENNAPVYLRTHPLTLERISDMQNRAQNAPYRQVPDSLEFHLIRTKLRAQEGSPQEARAAFESALQSKKFSSEAALHYGIAATFRRERNYAAAQKELDWLSQHKIASPMIRLLAAQTRADSGDAAGAQALFRAAHQRYPQARALSYGYISALLDDKKAQAALEFIESEQLIYRQDFRFHEFTARAHAALGHELQKHRALAEMAYLQGLLPAALEQLRMAQNAHDGNFYEHSIVDARMRELRKEFDDREKERRSGALPLSGAH
ncbi:MAG: M48 family metalloprotease [Betaproteobacteria bacterium]|nr:M48 family metalloprotease [Betaproteobacteria bacterium]